MSLNQDVLLYNNQSECFVYDFSVWFLLTNIYPDELLPLHNESLPVYVNNQYPAK